MATGKATMTEAEVRAWTAAVQAFAAKPRRYADPDTHKRALMHDIDEAVRKAGQ